MTTSHSFLLILLCVIQLQHFLLPTQYSFYYIIYHLQQQQPWFKPQKKWKKKLVWKYFLQFFSKSFFLKIVWTKMWANNTIYVCHVFSFASLIYSRLKKYTKKIEIIIISKNLAKKISNFSTSTQLKDIFSTVLLI